MCTNLGKVVLLWENRRYVVDFWVNRVCTNLGKIG